MAEKRTASAVLRRPERLDEMSWVAAQDFADPRYRAVMATLAGLRDGGRLQPIPAHQVDNPDYETKRAMRTNLGAVAEAMLAQRGGTENDHGPQWPAVAMRDSGRLVDELHDLFSAAVGVDAGQYLRYAKIVLEMSTRRQLEDVGVAMVRAASSGHPDTHREGTVPVVQATSSAMDATLNRLDRADRRATGEHLSRLETVDENLLQAPQVSTVATPMTPSLVRRMEEQLIHAAATNHDGRVDELVARFAPEHFVAAPEHAPAWSAISNLVNTGDRVDPCLVAFEAERLASADPEAPAGLPSAAFEAMAETRFGGDLDRAMRVVERSALLAQAEQARADIAAAAADRGVPVQQAIATARTATASVGATAARLAGRAHGASTISQSLSGVSSPPAAVNRR